MTDCIPKQWSPDWREQMLTELRGDSAPWDLIIVGGGITGAGIYREASRLKLRVLLIEQQDFAWGTSSRSSKMVHGGLRYLGSGQFKLARDSVRERQRLLQSMPGLVDPLPFMMGHYKGGFPGPWLFDKVLAVYDFLAGKRYRQFISHGLRDFWLPGLKADGLRGATRFMDAVTDDARLVMRVLHEGNEAGGLAINYLKAVDTLRDGESVAGVVVSDQLGDSRFELRAKAVINASGAWSDELRATLGKNKQIRPLRGSHLVVPFWRMPVAYSVSFFHPKDKRPVFVFPWEGVTVIGTTDLDHHEDMSKEAGITPDEVEYLLHAANAQFPDIKLQKKDIRSTWSGVRPVVSKSMQGVKAGATHDPSDEKREHAIWDDNGLISVAGGKLTTFSLIAQEVLEQACTYLNGENICAKGGASQGTSAASATQDMHGISAAQRRLSGRYGKYARAVASPDSAAVSELLVQHGLDKNARVAHTDTQWSELIWACTAESVVHLDDLLLRRTRLGLLLDKGGISCLPVVKTICQRILGWSDQTWQQEVERYQRIVAEHYSLPGKVPKQVNSKVHERAGEHV